MENNPLVTVNILSCNRRDELKFTLTKVYEQDYKNIEVIVVDNASKDGSPEMVESEFPSVKLILLEKNIGIAGWNEGFKVANGEYVLVLDDDSYPDKNTIFSGIDILKNKPKVGIVAFNIQNTRFNFSETKDFLLNPLSFNGCGALIKIGVIHEIGYYNELIFIYLNELDYSARCYNKGYSIKYVKEIFVFHNQSPNSRSVKIKDPFKSDYRYYHFFMGMMLFLIQYFDLRYTLVFTSKWMLNRLLICIRYNYYQEFFRAVKDVIKVLPRISRKNILNYDIQSHYNFGNFFALVDRDYFPNFTKPKWLKKIHHSIF